MAEYTNDAQKQKELEGFLKMAWCIDGPCEMQPLAKITFRGPYFKLTDSRKGTFYVALIPENLLFVEEEVVLLIGGVKVSKEVYEQVKQFSRERRKVLAVKAIRNYTGLGLRESKCAVDHYWETMGFTYDNGEKKPK